MSQYHQPHPGHHQDAYMPAPMHYANAQEYQKNYQAGYTSYRVEGDSPYNVPMIPVVEEDGDAEGPLCTDGSWFGGFGILSVLFVLLAAGSTLRADRGSLFYLPDYQGAFCGGGGNKGKPYLYYPLDPAARGVRLLWHAGQCVAECPSIKEVGRPLPVPMIQNEIDSANPASAGIMVRYTIQSPKYASEPEAGNFCMPLDKSLRRKVVRKTSTWQNQTRRAIGSVSSAWPALLRDVMCSLILFAFVHQVLMPVVPRITLQLITGSIGLLVSSAAIAVTYWGFNKIYTLPYHYAELFSWTAFLAKVTALTLLIFTPCTIILLFANYGVLWEGVRHAASMREVVKDLQATAVAPAILALGGVLCFILYIMAMQGLASLSTTTPVKGHDAFNSAVPFFRETSHFSWSALIVMLTVTVGVFWLLLTFRSASRYCGAYVGICWFFAPPHRCGCDERSVSGMEGIYALQTALSVSLGTNALYGAFMGAVGPLVTSFGFISRRKSPHLTPTDGDQLTESYPTSTPAEMSEVACWLASRLSPAMSGVAAVADCVHSAALTDVILNGNDLILSMDTTRKRMVQSGPLMRPSVAGRFVGSYALVGSLLSVGIALAGSLSTFISVSARSVFYSLASDDAPRVKESFGFFQYTYPSSDHFVSNPLMAAALSFVVIYYICDLIVGFHEGIVDSVTYLYIVDIQSMVTSAHSQLRYGPVEEHPCSVERAPAAFKTLLTKLLETELGVFRSPSKYDNGLQFIDGVVG